MDASQLSAWAPSHLSWQPIPHIEWFRVGKHRFDASFYDQTIEKCFHKDPFNLLFTRRTSLAELLALAESAPGLTPSGFVFHMSRCGSTLISRTLAQQPSFVSLSEPAVLEDILNLEIEANQRGFTLPHDEHIALLRAVISALGQARLGETHFIIKFDAWGAHHLPLIQEAFPTVPWVFVYRDPVEVLVSQKNMPGLQALPGVLAPAVVGLTDAELAELPQDAYTALVIGKICEAAVAAYETTALPARLIAYPQLPGALFETVLPLFGISLPDEALAQLRQQTTRSAKSPESTFTSDSVDKQARAGERLRELAAQYIQPAYAQLEALRLRDSSPENT